MRVTSARDVRAAIAWHMLGPPARRTIGDVTLHAHQVDAAGRISRLLEECGGALLADDVGLGKTYVALAIARSARACTVVAPAALRDVWIASAKRAQLSIAFESVEMLSRRGTAHGAPDLVIIDEAHHLRSVRTRRFAAASALCASARVLLLSATPVQNRLRDLRNLLSLFLGERAHALPPDALARYVVRRDARDLTDAATLDLPAVEPPEWLPPVEDVDCLDRLLSLPAAVPPVDGDDGGVLLTYTLARQWASSRAALRSALQRRLARGLAMRDALAAGRLPSRAELLAWCFADGVQQLAFPELAALSRVDDARRLLHQIERHLAGVRELLSVLDASPDPDTHRARLLRELRARRRGERIVAFSEYTDTVAALYRVLARDTRVAMLTHRGGRIAGGPITRRELLRRFAPGAAARTGPSDHVDLLLTTDVLSEGVDLQDASVVVHLDLAWNPARLEQRVGRLRRIGSPRGSVGVYLFAPPVHAERLLRLEHRLRVKLAVAGRSVGVAGAILPGAADASPPRAYARREEQSAAAMRAWGGGSSDGAPAGPVAAAIRSEARGALACVRRLGDVSLVAVTDSAITANRAAIEHLVAGAGGADAPCDAATVHAIVRRLEHWARREDVARVVDLPALHVANARRSLLHRVNAIARRTPRCARATRAPLMAAARTAATATLSAGAERVLDELASAPMDDEAWLSAVGAFASLHAPPTPSGTVDILALLVFAGD